MLRFKHDSMTIDLKVALWDVESELWENNVLEKIKLAFEGKSEPITIFSCPRDVTRYGEVQISKGQAIVKFYSEWDTPSSLIPDNITDSQLIKLLEEKIEDYFDNLYSFTDEGKVIIAKVEKVVESDDFNLLMKSIDKAEIELLLQEGDNGVAFDSWMSALTEN